MAKTKSEPAQNISKMQMVETALDTLGMDSSPSAIHPWILETYQMDIDRQMISSYASQIRKKRRSGLDDNEDGPPTGLASRDLATLQALIRKVGAAELQSYIKVLAR